VSGVLELYKEWRFGVPLGSESFIASPTPACVRGLVKPKGLQTVTVLNNTQAAQPRRLQSDGRLRRPPLSATDVCAGHGTELER
jgi:hypothetical protein